MNFCFSYTLEAKNGISSEHVESIVVLNNKAGFGEKTTAFLLQLLKGQSLKKGTNGALLGISKTDCMPSLSHRKSSMGECIYPLSHPLVSPGSKFSLDEICSLG